MTSEKEFAGLLKMNEARKSIPGLLAASCVMAGLLLACPALRGAAQFQFPSPEHVVEAQRDAVELEMSEAEQDPQQAKQDKKEAERDRQAMMEDLYNEGQSFLDEGAYAEAGKKFAELAKMVGPQEDAALYWKAYADNKLGKRDSALEAIADLKTRFPQSRWKKDAEALEIEVRQNSGHPVNPDSQNNDDLKILALQGIMNNDPARGIPMVEKYLGGSATPKEKSKALFLLVQSGSPQAQEMLAKIARGQSNPELQRKAVEYLGMTGGKGSGKLLGEVYANTSDAGVKHAVLRSYMIAGDREDLVAVAKKETNEELKREAIRQLGLVGGRTELLALFQSDNSVETKKEILQALFLSGDSEHLSQLALSEKNPDLRKAAIRNLGLLGAKDPALQTIYAKETDRGVKQQILDAYFIGGNASGLVAIARSEKDPELKKIAVSKLSLMNSKEGNDYLMELLQK